MSNGGVFEACRALTAEEWDTESVLQCVAGRLEKSQAEANRAIDQWLLILCGSLVFFMQAGFAMVCAGSVRRKNTQNTMLKNLLDACGAAVAFYALGYAFSFGNEGHDKGTTFIGLGNFFGMGDIDMSVFFFQYTFSAATVTIGFVYPVVAHSVWSSHGFMSSFNPAPLLGVGMVDFAGSGVVHLTGGTTALFATYILGSRRGRFYDIATGAPLETPKPMPGHSVSLQILGAFILWFGWFGFNPGSALLLGDNPYKADIGALAAVNTFLSSSAGCISAVSARLLMSNMKNGDFNFDLMAAMNGSLSGLVAITAGCGVVEPWVAVIVGAIAGLIYLGGSDYLIHLRLDDAVDAIPVHMFNGLWGLLAVGLMASPEHLLKVIGTDEHPGFFYSFATGVDASLLGCQVLGILFIFGWALCIMLPFFMWLNFMGWFRSESVQELVGLDIAYGAGPEMAANGEEENIREEYLDAFTRYQQSVKTKKSKKSKSTKEDPDEES